MKVFGITKYLYYISLICYLVICFLPIVSRRIGNMSLLIVVLCLFFLGIKKRVIIEKNFWIVLLIELLYLVLQYLRVSHITASGNLYENILFLIPMICFSISDNDDQIRNKIVLITFIVLQTYVAIVNIRLLIEVPYLSKYMTGGVEYVVRGYQNSNLGSLVNVFSSVFASLFLFVLGRITKKQVLKIAIYIVLATNIVFVVLARSFICIFSLLLGLILIINHNKHFSKRKMANGGIFIILGFIVLAIILFGFANPLKNLVSNSNIPLEYKNRLIDVLNLFVGEKNIESLGFINGRIKDYFLSIKTFIFRPILGVGMVYTSTIYNVGMHSEVLDYLARYGLVGACLLYYLGKKYFACWNVKRTHESLNLLFVILVYSMFNPIISRTAGILLFLILPCALKKFNQEESVNDINSGE